MPRQIRLDGVIHSFPDDATDEEISQSLGGTTQPAPEQIGHPQTPEELKSALSKLPEFQPLGVGDYLSTLGREAKAAASVIPGIYHAFADPDTQEETARLKARYPNGVPEGLSGPGISRGMDRMVAQPAINAASWYKQLIQGKIPNASEQALDVAPEAVGGAAGSMLLGKATTDPAAVVRGAAKTYNAGLRAGQAVAPIAGVAEGAYLLSKGNPAAAAYSAVTGGILGKVLRQAPEAPASMTEFGTPAEALGKIKAAAENIQPVPLKMAKPVVDPYSGPRIPKSMETAQSTTIDLHGYHPESQTMTVQFKNGKVYELRGVPKEVFDAYKNSESQGSFYQQNLKGRYTTNYMGTAKK